MIEAAYMTGILPIKKYGTQSAMTDFKEYTMLSPRKLAEYVGFTEMEVKSLCKLSGMDFEKMRKWYDGYSFSRIKSVYSPNSVMEAIKNEEFGSYWTQTETYVTLQFYIDMDEDAVAAAIDELPSGHGYADVVFFPKKASTMPLILIELKWNKTDEGAIDQIKNRDYPQALRDYGGKMLLVGINYDPKSKKHTCVIETYEKQGMS